LTNQQTTIGATSSQEIPSVHNARLTGSEIAQLWTTFMQYTMLTCVFRHFEATVQDPPIKDIITQSLSRFEKRVSFVADTFQKENIPIPMGFTSQDVNLSAPPLFSEIYVTHYVRNMIRLAMTLSSLNLNMSTRPDIRDFYASVLESIIRLNTEVTDLLLAKGVLPRPPYVSISQEVEHIHKPGFLTGFFGEKRPLLTIEIAHLYYNALTNEVGKALLLAFRQVSPNKEVRDYFAKGIHLSDSIVDKLVQIAKEENVNFSFIRDEDITDSTEAPFSDKLMMFHIHLMNGIGAGMYGVSGAVSARHDIMKMYAQFMLEVGQYAEAGAKIMMSNDWLEEPPQVLDRDKLAEYMH